MSWSSKQVLKCFLPMACLLIWASTQAQDLPYEVFDWQEERARMAISDAEAQEPAIILRSFVAHEYAYNSETLGLDLYNTTHKIIRVNNDDAIQGFNKIYVPMSGVEELIEVKARAISPDGKVVVLNNDNIKDVTDDEGGQGYKIFAVEGVELGSEIEYLHRRKMLPSYFGREYFQNRVPIKEGAFKLISPENLEFSVKGYNGLPKPEAEKAAGKRHITATATDVPVLKEEEFSYFNANRMRLEYKLSYNHFQGDERLLTWADAAQRLHGGLFLTDDNLAKTVLKYYKGLKVKNSASNEDKIRAIENHIKSNFAIKDVSMDEFSDVAAIINNQYGNPKGITKLFAAMLKVAEVPFELVLTSDRSDIPFDGDFESWNYFTEYALYFPDHDTYLSPDNPFYRYGMLPFNITHNYGLFISEANIGNTTTGVGNIKFIPALGYEKSYDNLDIQIKFNEGMEKATMEVHRAMSGYNGAQLQAVWPFIPEDERRAQAEALIKSSAEDATFVDVQVTNGEQNLSPLTDPFTIDATLETAAIIERAGNRYLLKLGEVIGPQIEMYQEDERVLDVENFYNRLYLRKISFTIPEGYTVKNLDQIKIYHEHQEAGDKVFLFESSYTVNGNEVTVQVDEYYKEINCDLEDFEAFRKVINAAADFNKVTLVFVKS